MSNHGGGLVGNHGSGLISDHGGGLVANHGSGRRLLAASEVERVRDDRRSFLWAMLAMVDANDQLIQGYLQAQARLGQWLRFRCPKLRILPLPIGAEIFNLALAQMEQALQAQAWAGHLSQGPDGLRLSLVALKAEGGALAEGTVVLDLTQVAGQAKARARFVPILAEALGYQELTSHLQPEAQGMRLETGERF